MGRGGGHCLERLSYDYDGALKADLDSIEGRLRVLTNIDAFLRATEKEFSLTANCAKGHSGEFKAVVAGRRPGAAPWP